MYCRSLDQTLNVYTLVLGSGTLISWLCQQDLVSFFQESIGPGSKLLAFFLSIALEDSSLAREALATGSLYLSTSSVSRLIACCTCTSTCNILSLLSSLALSSSWDSS